MSMDVHCMLIFIHKNESDSECFTADIQSTKKKKKKMQGHRSETLKSFQSVEFREAL